MKRYSSITFKQGDDGMDAEQEIYLACNDATPGSVEWVEAAFDYLIFYYPDEREEWRESSGYGASDDVYDYVSAFGTYQITYNPSRGYIGLTEVKEFTS